MADPKRTRPEEAHSNANYDAAVEQLKAIDAYSAVVGAPPDHSPVWQSEDFQKLSPAEQESLRAKFAGGSLEQDTPEPRPERETAPETRQPDKTETSERSRQRPKTWIFQNYQLKPDRETDGFLIFEKKQRWSEEADKYETSRHPQRTEIKVPEALAARIRAGEVRPEEVRDFCENLRRRLDGPEKDGGLRLLFDRAESSADDLPRVPIWKYAPEEAAGSDRKPDFEREPISVGDEPWADRRDKFVSPDILPQNLFKIADDYWRHNGKEYWRDQTWRDWYGRALQRKREDIISAELSRRDFGAASEKTTVRPESERRETAETRPVAAAPKPDTSHPERRDTPPGKTERTEAAPPQAKTVEKKEAAPPLTAGQVARDATAFIRHLRMAYEPVYTDQSTLSMRLVDATVKLLEEQYVNIGQLPPKSQLGRENGGEYRNLVARLVRFGAQHPRLERFQEAKVIPVGNNRVVFELDSNGTEALARTFVQSVRELVADALEQRWTAKPGEPAEMPDAAAREATAVSIVKIVNKAKNPQDRIIGFDTAKGLLNVNDHKKFEEKAVLLYLAKKKLSDLAKKNRK